SRRPRPCSSRRARRGGRGRPPSHHRVVGRAAARRFPLPSDDARPEPGRNAIRAWRMIEGGAAEVTSPLMQVIGAARKSSHAACLSNEAASPSWGRADLVVRGCCGRLEAMLFRDRADAGRQLARALERYRGRDAVVLALPRGGVPVAAVIAEELAVPLDLLLVRKVGVPFQPELAMGAVIDGADPVVVRNEEVIATVGVAEETFRQACRKELAEIERRRGRYLGGRAPVEVAGR